MSVTWAGVTPFSRSGLAIVAGLLSVALSGGVAAAQPGGPALAAGTITTIAGGVGGPAKATTVSVRPCGVAYGAGNLYIADLGLAVHKIRTTADWLTTPAGTGAAGPAHNGALAAKASLRGVCGMATDHAGNLVMADLGHYRVWVMAASTGTFYGRAMKARHIYSVAGTGHRGFSGDGGPATEAAVVPKSVAVDGAGNLVVADSDSNRVRVVAARTGAFYGQAMTAGDIYTVAGTGTAGYSGDGGPARRAELNLSFFPRRVGSLGMAGVVVDGAGNLVVADSGNNRVRVVAARTGTFYGHAMTAGDIYTVAGTRRGGSTGDGVPGTAADLDDPSSVAVDGSGNLVLADSFHDLVRVVAASTGTFYGQAMTAGDIYTVAGNGSQGYVGDGGLATSTSLFFPDGVTVDGSGNLVVSDAEDSRVRVVAARAGTFYGQAMTGGHIYTVAGNGATTVQGDCCMRFSGDGGPATMAQLSFPEGVAVDHAGNVVIVDTVNNRVRAVAASTGTFYGQAMTAGDMYTVAGDGAGGNFGDGGPATAAELFNPGAVTVDAAGNLVIADTGDQRIRVVAASTATFYGQAMTAGDIYTVAGTGIGNYSGDGGPATAAELQNPGAVTVDAAGNLVIADTSNNRIRVVAADTGTFYGQAMTAGDIYTVAGTKGGYSGDGGPATVAELKDPSGVAVDGAGNLVVADTRNNRIRVVAARTGTFYGQAMTAGDIYTVAGTGIGGHSGDGGPATAAEFNNPRAVTVDAAGNLVIADTHNNRIRVVAASPGTFYGQAMTAGDIYTVAGTSTRKGGYSGDGGPATAAEINSPRAVAVNGAGNLLIADYFSDRIRQVTG